MDLKNMCGTGLIVPGTADAKVPGTTGAINWKPGHFEVDPSIKGAAKGAAIGGAIGGPPGAVIGGIIGGILGPTDKDK